MAQVDVAYLGYMCFRLLPFLVASVLVISPLFNQNARGVVYLVGLVLATSLTTLCGHYILTPEMMQTASVASASCATFALGARQVYSRTPLDLSVLGYSTGYLFYSIFANDLAQINMATLAFFPVAIISTLWWLIINSCFSYTSCALALFVSGGAGVAWAAIVHRRAPGLQYLYAPSNKEVCVKQNDGLYKCSNTNANGAIL